MFKQNYSILIVEDEKYSRDMLVERLEDMPFIGMVSSVSNGLSAIQYLRENIVDIVFTDIKMPVMSGFELAEYVSKFLPYCQVVFFSGYEEFDYAQKAISYGVTEYLLKPLDLQQVHQTLEKCFGKIEQRRRELLNTKNYSYEKLQQQLSNAFRKKSNDSRELFELSLLFEKKAFVVYLETERVEKDKQLDFYQNILSDILPGWIVLFLTQNKKRNYYLLVLREDESELFLNGISGYLNRVLEGFVSWDIIQQVDSMEQIFQVIQETSKDEMDIRIQKACDYIAANYSKQLSREDVAKSVWLSPSYFSYLFRTIKGIGFNEYLTQLRIKKAEELLLEEENITSIANAVGYCDPRYFSVAFRKNTGYSPTEYRRMILKKE